MNICYLDLGFVRNRKADSSILTTAMVNIPNRLIPGLVFSFDVCRWKATSLRQEKSTLIAVLHFRIWLTTMNSWDHNMSHMGIPKFPESRMETWWYREMSLLKPAIQMSSTSRSERLFRAIQLYEDRPRCPNLEVCYPKVSFGGNDYCNAGINKIQS